MAKSQPAVPSKGTAGRERKPAVLPVAKPLPPEPPAEAPAEPSAEVPEEEPPAPRARPASSKPAAPRPVPVPVESRSAPPGDALDMIADLAYSSSPMRRAKTGRVPVSASSGGSSCRGSLCRPRQCSGW